jgi:hypothetical protein
MEVEKNSVYKCIQGTFTSASDIFIDTSIQECEVTVSVDEFEGEINRKIMGNGVKLLMVDYSDVYPYKYVFSYSLLRS